MHDNKKYYITLAVAFVIALVFLLEHKTPAVQGSAPSGLEATIATSTAFTISNATSKSGITLTSTTTGCAARIITTSSSTAYLAFGYGGALATPAGGATTTPFGNILQAASTTVAYDAGIYGCATVRVVLPDPGATSPNTLLFMETR